MGHILQDLQSHFYDLMGFPSADMGYKSYPAIIMLEFGPVQSLLLGPVFHCLSFLSLPGSDPKKSRSQILLRTAFLCIFFYRFTTLS